MHECDRPRRIGLRQRNTRQRRQHDNACGEMQKLSSVWTFHGVLQRRRATRARTLNMNGWKKSGACRWHRCCPLQCSELGTFQLRGQVWIKDTPLLTAEKGWKSRRAKGCNARALQMAKRLLRLPTRQVNSPCDFNAIQNGLCAAAGSSRSPPDAMLAAVAFAAGGATGEPR